MALLGKGKKDGGGSDTPGSIGVGGEGSWEPDKARSWFKHARTTQETGNYDYAMQLWLRGMSFDATDMNALESFAAAATSFVAENGKKSPSKETRLAAGGKGAVGRYLAALFAWTLKPADTANAVKAAEAASQAELAEPSYWIGERALRVVGADPKAKKDHAVRLMRAMSAVGAHDLAVKAGEIAIRLDPTDGGLVSEVRNMSAQATMSSGGFEDSGQGGFRKNIRDADRQAMLEAEDSISKTDETKEKLLAAAASDYQARPDDIPATKTYIKRLLERGREDDEKLAYKLAMRAYEQHGQFSFRQQAGDIRLRVARRQVLGIRQRAEAGDQKAASMLPQAEVKFRELEIEEFAARVEAFPTDNAPKFELARRYFEAGEYQKAIPLLQKSQSDNKYKARSLAMLGESFGRIGLTDPAIDTLRQAIASHSDTTDEVGLSLRYALMDALLSKANTENDRQAATEGEKLAGAIVAHQYDYRDIGERYNQAKALVTRLRNP